MVYDGHGSAIHCMCCWILFAVLLKGAIPLSAHSAGHCDQSLISDRSVLTLLNPSGDPQKKIGIGDTWLISKSPPIRLADISDAPAVSSLWISLNSLSVIREVALWGHQGAYFLQYRFDDAEANWRFVSDGAGQPILFRSSKKLLSSVEKIPEPVIASHFRFIPVSVAGDEGSFQVDLYGCSFDADRLHFTGESLITTDLDRKRPVNSRNTDIRILFRTKTSDGILLSAVGSHDFLVIQLNRGRVQMVHDFGCGTVLWLKSNVSVNDGLWHRLHWEHRSHRLKLLIDGVVCAEKVAKGIHEQLGLNIKLTVGAPILLYPILDQNDLVKSNFTGCISEATINGRSFLDGRRTGIRRNAHSCLSSVYQHDCVTFESNDAWLELKSLDSQDDVNLYFEFRTYSRRAHLAEIPLRGDARKVKMTIEKGRILLDVVGKNLHKDMFEHIAREMYVSDMLWHTVELRVSGIKGRATITLAVDDFPLREINSGYFDNVKSGSEIIFGGSEFQGCIRNVHWNGKLQLIYDSSPHGGSIEWNTCTAVDKCEPNPCENGGSCFRSLRGYRCKCASGYSGRNCHRASFPLSCEQHLAFGGEKGGTWLDIDGPGSLPPFKVVCNYTENGVVSSLEHDQPNPLEVRGFEKAGSFNKLLDYHVTPAALDSFVRSFGDCRQPAKLECFGGARFMNGGNSGNPSSWWMGRTGSVAYSWGGLDWRNRLCTCGITGTCINDGSEEMNIVWMVGSENTDFRSCNCDSGEDAVDEAEIGVMDQLPIRKMFVGDTDRQNKRITVTIGPLVCTQSLAWQPVTFTQRDSRLEAETNVKYDSWIEVYFEFRTTQESGVFVYNQLGSDAAFSDWLKIYLKENNQIVVEISAAGSLWTLIWGPRVEERVLSDDLWHSVRFEMTRRYAKLVLDRKEEFGKSVDDRLLILPRLDKKWLIGASSEYSAGFAGIMRGVVINGEQKDLVKEVMETKRKGVVSGVVRQCDENPCFNDGLCMEHYDDFSCDCTKTPFVGRRCLEDVGFEFNGAGWMKYRMKPSHGVASGNIRIGFQTESKDVTLLKGGPYWTEDLSLELHITSEGHLKLIYFDGKKSYGLLDDRKNYADSTYYDVRIHAFEHYWILEVGYYEELKLRVDGKEVDAKGIGKWIIGSRNFSGCVSRLQLGKAVPFQKRESSYPRLSVEGKMRFESAICPLDSLQETTEITLGGDQFELSPIGLPSIEIEPVKQANTSGIIVASLCGILLVLVLGCCCCWRCVRNRPAGEYKTHEGDELYLTPDNSHTALVSAVPPRRREWFI